jgi:hypothetical protein
MSAPDQFWQYGKEAMLSAYEAETDNGAAVGGNWVLAATIELNRVN